MSKLPAVPSGSESGQSSALQLYDLLAQQVQSYHRYRHMGENTSVSSDLAAELLRSVEYTVSVAGGMYPGADLLSLLRSGQALLLSKKDRADRLLALVKATAPENQTECRWDAMVCLEQYLARYDPLHLAHTGPDELFYPNPMSEPEDISGLDTAMHYLQVLWTENQIFTAFAALPCLPQVDDPSLNLCEQLIDRLLGDRLLRRFPSAAGYDDLIPLLGEDPFPSLAVASAALAEQLPQAAAYIAAAAAALAHRIRFAAPSGTISWLFV